MFRRNTYLWSVIVVGAIVTTVGGTGIFAVFTDRAIQGPNIVNSEALPKAADLQIASFVAGSCTQFEEELTTYNWLNSDLQPGDAHDREFCVKNNGAATVSLTLTALDFFDNDAECTGDEQTVDPDCGSGMGYGQLAGNLELLYAVDADCDASYGEPTEIVGSHGLLALAGNAIALTTVSPLTAGNTMCLRLTLSYPTTTSLDAVQAAQSDGMGWKFAFDGATID